MRIIRLSCALLLACICVSGCPATQKTATLNSAVESFDKAIESAKSSLETERKSRPRVRRYEAIEYYVKTRTLDPGKSAVIPDFLPGEPLGSFAKYACAGQGALIRESNALSRHYGAWQGYAVRPIWAIFRSQ
jgi:hypothetical protein